MTLFCIKWTANTWANCFWKVSQRRQFTRIFLFKLICPRRLCRTKKCNISRHLKTSMQMHREFFKCNKNFWNVLWIFQLHREFLKCTKNFWNVPRLLNCTKNFKNAPKYGYFKIHWYSLSFYCWALESWNPVILSQTFTGAT